MKLKFLSNVDPVDFARCVDDSMDIEETLFIVVSKTFTTAETMMNARVCRQAIMSHYEAKAMDAQEAVSKHMCAVSTNLDGTKAFGIDDKNVFAFWDWVGGRYSVSSAVGLLPLSLNYGYDNIDKFLSGMSSVDRHFSQSKSDLPTLQNAPMMLGLIGFYNTYIAQIAARNISPYQ